MTKEFEQRRFEMERLKEQGADVGAEKRQAVEELCFEEADKRIDQHFKNKRAMAEANQRLQKLYERTREERTNFNRN